MNWMCLVAGTGLLGLMAWTARAEGERRAAGVSLALLGANAALWLALIAGSGLPGVRLANQILLGLAGAAALVSLVRWFPRAPERDLSGLRRYDERDHMFARNNTWRHPETADRYYDAQPERRAVDAPILQKPQLGEPGGRYYDPLLSPVAEAAFEMLDRSAHLAEGETAGQRREILPADATRVIRKIGLLYGAVDVGVAPLREYHFYTHAGRQIASWGQPLEPRPGFGVVIVVAMDFRRIRQAPRAPVLLESSRQYVEAAKIAHLVAGYIRGLGYAARAHVDAHYEVACVPVARDAGLGEVGRMGLLMHRVYGPCVRLSVVTTDLELVPTGGDFRHLASFCQLCRKCAATCPAAAIPDGEEPESRGFRHWTIRQEACYNFWRTVGTDCAVCIRTCPFTKPDTPVHRLVRAYVRRNPLNQRLALWADDLFYGRRLRPEQRPTAD
jgi:epoxyqueuosine reductase QueG